MSFEMNSDGSITTTIDGRVITLTKENIEKQVRQQDNVEDFAYLLSKIIEAGSSAKMTISKSESGRPMVNLHIDVKSKEAHIFGDIRLMRGKKGTTTKVEQKAMLIQQCPNATDNTDGVYDQ